MLGHLLAQGIPAGVHDWVGKGRALPGMNANGVEACAAGQAEESNQGNNCGRFHFSARSPSISRSSEASVSPE
jgi:hypothetical protein